jgi:hypothetical protein
VEKIGLTSTSFGINFSPDIVIIEKALLRCSASQGERGEDRAYLNFVRHKPLARYCNNRKSPASLVQLRRANVEKIGLTSTSFGISYSLWS